MYHLTNPEKDLLQNGIRAAYAIPFIDDIEDYIWEAIFSNMKGITLIDPMRNTRSKELYDVLDPTKRIGWSAKALQCTITTERLSYKRDINEYEFELVIQRADIIKKRASLGFPDLSLASDPQDLGKALLEHWYTKKIESDSISQNIIDKRICILLKSIDRRTYAYYEDDIAIYPMEKVIWAWSNSTNTGLKGSVDGFCKYKWYPNQKQFFERFRLPKDAYIFNLDPKRIRLNDLIGFIDSYAMVPSA